MPTTLRKLRFPKLVAFLLLFALVGAACSSAGPEESTGSGDSGEGETDSAEQADDSDDDDDDDASTDDEEPDETDDEEATGVALPQDVPLSSAPGVDAESIRIGVLIRDVNQLIGTGFVEDLTVTQQVDRWRAEAGRINNAGGVNGREIEIVVSTWDPLVPESLLTACDRIATSRDAFIVLNTSGLETLASSCVTDPHSRPVLVGEGPPTSEFEASNNLLFSLEPPREVLIRTAMERFESEELLQGRVAVMHADLDGDVEAADLAMSILNDLGYVATRESIPASQGVEAAIESMPAKINALISDRTDTVIMLSNSTLAQPLGLEMNRYGADWSNLIIDVDNIADPFAASRIGAAWDGAFAVSAWGGVTLPETDIETQCRQGWNDFLNGEFTERPRGDWSFSAGLEERSTRGAAPDSQSPPGDIGYTECLMMHLVTDALDRVPLNFTVADFVDALESSPRIIMPLGANGSFGPDDHSFADRAGILQFLRWSSGFCPTESRDCFVPLNGDRSSFRELADPPQAADEDGEADEEGDS